MILSDADIIQAIQNKHIYINPMKLGYLQPSSIDVTLHSVIATVTHTREVISVTNPPTMQKQDISETGYVLFPGEMILGALDEWIEIDNTLVARIEGKSSLGRIGLGVHITAGYVDPGWKGRLTVEIKNHALYDIEIRAGMKIAQISFIKLLTPSIRIYGTNLGSKYNNAVGVEGAKPEIKLTKE